MKLSSLALLGAAGIAVAQNHAHQHRHPARQGSPVEREMSTTTTVPGPIVTIFELNGESVSYEEVLDGLKSGKYVIVGDTITNVVSAKPSTTSTSSASSSKAPASSSSTVAEFYEAKIFSSSTSTTPTSTYVAPTTSSSTSTTSTSTAAATTTAAQSSYSSSGSSSSSSSGSGVDSKFPSGTIKCSEFPSSYGAVYIDYLGLDGWTGIQNVPNYSPGDSAISYIETATSGGCTKGSFCSYACPAGYQKSQWPTAQGSTGQSIGGLYCNSNGYLELSRTSVSTLCEAGAGGVTVVNKLSKNVAICRTDYPGLESETIPLNVEAGATEEVCNPNELTYYQWEGAYTSAQYYINPSGYGPSEACIWGSSGTDLGNWAPVNLGVGESSTGVTYLSLFPNSPTNPTGTLDYNIAITGDVSGSCSYKNKKYYSNGAESSTGCTVSTTGSAVITFS